MKLLLDTCIWGGAKKILENTGYDTLWIGDFIEDPGDEAIINLAHKENRVLVTLDKDFGELAVVKGTPHSGNQDCKPSCNRTRSCLFTDLAEIPERTETKRTHYCGQKQCQGSLR